MSSTDKEKDMIKDWAVKATYRIEGYDRDRLSFWNDCSDDDNIAEYNFGTVPELKKLIDESVVGCEKVKLPMSVAGFKKKEEFREKKKTKEYKDFGDFSIPEFIYVF